MPTKKVLLLEAHNGSKYEFYKKLGEVAELSFENKEGGYTEQDLAKMIEPYDAVMISSQHAITSKVINSAPKLKIIAKKGAKPSNVDIKAATKNGVVVTWTPGVNYSTVAEHTIMLVLCLAKQTIPLRGSLQNGNWRSTESDVTVQDINGKTIGIIGLGGIGKKVTMLADALGATTMAYDPYVSESQVEETGVKLSSLEELLRKSDFVTLHAALTKETRYLIDKEELETMKKEAYLINTARGGLINESALIKALQNGIIAGAGLDVFEKEPPESENPLMHLPNVVATPHMAGWSEEAIYREQKEASLEISRVIRGDKPRYPINPEAWEEKVAT